MRINGDGVKIQMLSFEVPVNTKRRLDKRAQVLGCSISDALRTLINKHLDDLRESDLVATRRHATQPVMLEGTIKSLNLRGFGWITGDDGRQYYFASTRRYLAPGTVVMLGRRVRFTPTDHVEKGPAAVGMRVIGEQP